MGMEMELNALRMLREKQQVLIDLIEIKEESFNEFKKLCYLDYDPFGRTEEIRLMYLYEVPHKITITLPFKKGEINFKTFYKDKSFEKYFEELKEEVIKYLENLIYQ